MRALLLVTIALIGACAGESSEVRQSIRVPGSLEGLPFASAVRVDDMLYLSGQIGTLPGTTQLIEGGVGAETRQTLQNIKTVLDYAGSSLRDVVKCTVFLVDIADYQEMNLVYRAFFGEDPPARSTVAGSGLALGAKVEIECTAVIE
jgi:reactive intermediate/imine deaminase